MIDISNMETYGWEAAIRGMRNPMNSWAKSDSREQCECPNSHFSGDQYICVNPYASYDDRFYIGPNDQKLMRKLCMAGPEHRKFMRMIFVSVDIKAPLYWWKQYDTYKIGTVANSCSTMHKLAANEFSLNDFSLDHIRNRNQEAESCMQYTIEELNRLRDVYLETKSQDALYCMYELLPSSYNQLRTETLNYEVLRNMYHQRLAHKLNEWREFCTKMRVELPFPELICGVDEWKLDA